MTNSFPSHSDSAHAEEVPKEDIDSYGQFLEIVPVDINADKETDESRRRTEQGPVPLPATTDGIEARIAWHVEFSMLGQDSKVENKSNSKSNSETNSDKTTSLDVLDRGIALSGIGPCTVWKDVSRSIWREGQVAFGVIGNGVVAVECVVEVFEGGEVEVDAAENGVAAVTLITLWPFIYGTSRDMGKGIDQAIHVGQSMSRLTRVRVISSANALWRVSGSFQVLRRTLQAEDSNES